MKKVEEFVSMLLVVVIFAIIVTPTHVYARTAIILGSRYLVDYYEILTAQSVANDIAGNFSDRGFVVYNWYGALTTRNNIYTAAGGVGDSRAAIFYVGHGDKEYVWNWAGWIWYYELQYYMHDDSGNKVFDKDIYSYSSNAYSRLAFLWSCRQGDEIGGFHWSGTPYGMPFAWLHTSDLSSDGYRNPYSNPSGLVFIGFNGYAPYLSISLGGVSRAGARFVREFYRQLLYGCSEIVGGVCVPQLVWQALDEVAYGVWGTTFSDSILYQGYDLDGDGVIDGRMVVYGDGNVNWWVLY